MMHSMNTTGMNDGFGFTFLWIVHVLSIILFFSGLVFLIVWAIKTLPAAQLKTWALSLLIGGAILCLLTIGIVGKPWSVGYETSRGGMMGGMGMSMDGMMNMLDGKTGDAFDEAFIEMMIPHHQGAIDMAEAALKSSKHPEMKELATGIIEAQQREIDMMKGWQREWGYEQSL